MRYRVDFDLQHRIGKRRNLHNVEHGKFPVRNSRRACHTFSRWLMSVTKIVTVTMSAIVPPAASIRCLILPKIALLWVYSSLRSPPLGHSGDVGDPTDNEAIRPRAWLRLVDMWADGADDGAHGAGSRFV